MPASLLETYQAMDGDYTGNIHSVTRKMLQDLCAGLDPVEERRRLLRILGRHLRELYVGTGSATMQLYGAVMKKVDLFTTHVEVSARIDQVKQTIDVPLTAITDAKHILISCLFGNDAGTIDKYHTREGFATQVTRRLTERALDRCHDEDESGCFAAAISRHSGTVHALNVKAGAYLAKHSTYEGMMVPSTPKANKVEGDEEL